MNIILSHGNMPEGTPIDDAIIALSTVKSTIPSTIYYAFQAQMVWKIENYVLPNLLIGSTKYDNPVMELLCGIKVDHWLFCLEECTLTPEAVRPLVIGAFNGTDHYNFGAIPKDNMPPGKSPLLFTLEWVIENIVQNICFPGGVIVPTSFLEVRSPTPIPGDAATAPQNANGTPKPPSADAARHNIVMGPVPIKKFTVVPNDVSATRFIAEHPELMP